MHNFIHFGSPTFKIWRWTPHLKLKFIRYEIKKLCLCIYSGVKPRVQKFWFLVNLISTCWTQRALTQCALAIQFYLTIFHQNTPKIWGVIPKKCRRNFVMIGLENCYCILDHQIFRGQWCKLRHFNSYHQFEQFSKRKHFTKITFPKCLKLFFFEKVWVLKNVVQVTVQTPRHGAPMRRPTRK